MLRFILTSSLIALGVASAPSTFAAPEPAPRTRSVRDLLSAIDVVPPDRASLERAFPNARAELLAIARDGSQSDWTRLRAVSLLSFFPEAATKAALVELGRDARVEVRRAALYTLGRSFGSIDASVVPIIADAAERDPDASTREHAVRALRWVDADVADEALVRVAERRPELRSVVDVTRERRAARLSR